MLVKVKDIKTGRNYRTNFMDIVNLADDIQAHGLIQPLTVNPQMELLAGERRLRAIQYLGWEEVEVNILDVNEQAQDEVTLVENLQRSDTNPIEEANAFQAYISKYDCTMADLAKKLHVSPDLVSSRLRLLNLNATMQDYVASGEIPLFIALPMCKLTSDQQDNVFRWLDFENLPNEKAFVLLCNHLQSTGSLDIAKTWQGLRVNSHKSRIRELDESLTDDDLEGVLKARQDNRKVYAVQVVYKPYFSEEMLQELAQIPDDIEVETEAVFSHLEVVELDEKLIKKLRGRKHYAIFTYRTALEVCDRVNPHDGDYPYYRMGKNEDGSNKVFMCAPNGYTGGVILPEMY